MNITERIIAALNSKEQFIIEIFRCGCDFTAFIHKMNEFAKFNSTFTLAI
jgi:hypothetical protein